MSRGLHNIKGKDAVKVFLKFGGVERKGKGDHINIKMPNGMIVTIPGSKELKIGLLKSVIKKAGLTEEEFLKLL
jgi:predicted RNA binding protein YcfA (HicA-like mRNA interferase family)